MKKTLILCGALIASSCSLMDPYDHLHPHGAFGMKLFKQQDTNGDGYISKKEAYRHHKAQFKTVDLNGDGKLTKAEAKKKGRIKSYHDLGRAKTEKGYLTVDETYVVEAYRFKQADDNKDGKISKKEFKKHYLESHKK